MFKYVLPLFMLSKRIHYGLTQMNQDRISSEQFLLV